MLGRNRLSLCLVLCLLAFGALAPAGAQPPILKGVDLLETSTSGGTRVDFAASPIPAGFFCAGSAAFTGVVNLKGVPIVTNPAGVANPADTVIERPADAAFTSTGVANVTAIVRALSLTSTSNLIIVCPGTGTTQWRVDTCLCGTQPTNTLQATSATTCGGSCGSLTGLLKLNICLRFTRIAPPPAVVLGPITRAVTLNVNGTAWCNRSGPGTPTLANSIRIDTNCDGVVDTTVLPTSNFFPGWTCPGLSSGQTCLQQYAALTHCHPVPGDPDHQHCVNPVCGQTH